MAQHHDRRRECYALEAMMAMILALLLVGLAWIAGRSLLRALRTFVRSLWPH